MVTIKLDLEGDGSLADRKRIIDASDGQLTVTCLKDGMTSGAPSVGIIIDMKSGETIFAQTSALLFITVAETIAAHFDLRPGGDKVTVLSNELPPKRSADEVIDRMLAASKEQIERWRRIADGHARQLREQAAAHQAKIKEMEEERQRIIAAVKRGRYASADWFLGS